MNHWRRSRIQSFKNALSGVWFNLRHEPNFLIQLTIAILVVSAGFIFTITGTEWVILILSIGAVLSAEAMNTAVEKICDRFFEEEDPRVRIIKDSSAAAVLIISLAALAVGLVIFLPYLCRMTP